MADFIEDYDRLISDVLQRYLTLSAKIGGIVNEQANLVQAAFQAQRDFLLLASRCRQPEDKDMQALLQPTSEKLLATQNIREKNRSSEYFTHLSAVSEAISALGWVVVYPDPSKYSKELHAAGAYFGNKVITGNKDKNPLHAEWAKTWLEVLNELHSYIREHHRCGLSWNPKGIAAAPYLIGAGDSSFVNAPGGAPPPPPPPPPAQLFTNTASDEDDVRAALFKEINRGADITRCLKRVNVSQTSKPQKVSSSAQQPIKTVGQKQGKISKPPRLELEGRKWCVEYHNNNELKISETSMNQSICVYQCHNTVIHVPSKVNCITLDTCKKTSLVFADIVSFVEFINCQDMKAQALQKVPTITIDKTDGVQIFLSENSLDVEIISSKSSEINICVPKDDDFVEFPVPEQFKTTVAKNGLKTTVVEKV